jgi:putative membrane protein
MSNNQIPAQGSKKTAPMAMAIGVVLALIIVTLVYLYPDAAYLWVKALHVIAVISWMAGMLYLPRLFVYHCAAEKGSIQSETFKVMEHRLLKAIINPAMILTWLLGLYLAWAGHWFSAPWLHGKLLLVIAMSGIHGFFSRCVRDFAADQNTRSHKFYRIINEVPTLLMIGIVILVVVKPF